MRVKANVLTGFDGLSLAAAMDLLCATVFDSSNPAHVATLDAIPDSLFDSETPATRAALEDAADNKVERVRKAWLKYKAANQI